MKRTIRDVAIVVMAMAVLALLVLHAKSEPQTRFYDARGNSLGTGVPQSDGSVRYYDSRGNSLGTSTTRVATQRRSTAPAAASLARQLVPPAMAHSAGRGDEPATDQYLQ
jgi:hypothetical protein